MRISDEARSEVAKLSAEVENNLRDGCFVGVLGLERAGQREGGGGIGEIVDDGMRVILKHHGRFRAAAQQLRRGAFIQQQVLVGGNAPAFQKTRRGPGCR